MKYANLHLHSCYSDGVYTPKELCEKAKKMGYGALALTDHETVSGCKAMAKAAAKAGLEYIPGFEAYAQEFGTSFHITCFDFDTDDKAICEYFRKLSIGAELFTHAKFDSLAANGIVKGITWQNVLDDAPENCWLCNEHIFASMIKRLGYTQSNYWDYMAEFRKQKVEVEKPFVDLSASTLISMIHNAGGITVLAHPHNQTQYLPALRELGLDGVECDHPDIYDKDIKAALTFAKENKMYISGGTDHTGQLGNAVDERGDFPGRREGTGVPYDTDVYCGVTYAEFEAIKNRIYG